MEKWYGSEEIVGFSGKCFIQKLKKLILVSSVIALMFFLFSGRAWAFSGGDGTPEMPYQISTPEELNDVKNYLSSHFVLINDIDLTEYLSESGEGYNAGAGWIPIGTSSTPFTGTFNGDNHIISGLHINRPSMNYVGLFGLTGSTAVISDIGLINVEITGKGLVGALAGGNYASVTNSFVTGNVTGTAYNVGGLVGSDIGTISDSYAVCNVDGTHTVGGLVGYKVSGHINRCYATGIVTVDEGQDLGGLTGGIYYTSTSYYNVSINGESRYGTGVPKTTTELAQQNTFSTWDFTNVWSINEGASYPYLQGSSYIPLPPAPTSVTVSPATLEFTYGDSVASTLAATVAPEYAVQMVNWSTSDSNIVTVNENGQVTPVGVGEATISAISTSTIGTRTGQAIVIVNKKELMVGNATADKIYDGTDEAIITGATLYGVETGDDVSLANHTVGTFAQSDAGTNISVSTNMTLSGTDAGNYTLIQPTLIANISTKELTVSATSENKTYDGAAEVTVTGATLNGVVTGDDVSLGNHTVGIFAQPDVGTNLSVSTAMTILGADAANYTLIQPTLTADITPKELTIGGNFTVENKVYDGTTDAAIDINSLTLEGIVKSDDVVLNAAADFLDGNAGKGKTVNLTDTSSLTGIQKDNYTLSLTGAPTTTADITSKELTVSATSENKAYDGTTEATVAGATLNGIVTGDDVSLGNHTVGTFDQPDVGTNLSVSTAMTLLGADAANYALIQPTLTADITPKELTIGGSFTVNDKVYDGTTNAAIEINSLTLEGVVGADDVTMNAVAAFFDETAGTGKTVGLTDTTSLTGIQKDNYILSLTGAPTATANINSKELTIGGSFTVNDKVYDGTTNAAIEINSLTLVGVVGADDVILYAAAAFSNENTGTDKAVNLTQDTSLNGDDKDNYILSLIGSPTTLADIIENSSDDNNSSRRRSSSSSSSSEVSVLPSIDLQNVIIVPVTKNKAGVALAEIDFDTLNSILKKASVNDDGKKSIEIEIPSLEGASVYESTLPAVHLSSDDPNVRFQIKTNIAEINLTGNMLEKEVTASSKKVSLTISQSDLSKVDEKIRSKIGDRPVIKLSLQLDGEQTLWNNPDAPVTVSIPYTPTAEELADPENITVWYIDGYGNVVEIPSGRYDPETGKVTFNTTHFSDYAVVFVKKSFEDIDSVAWAKEQIEVLASKGILKGISEKEYEPQTNITRADFLYSLIRALDVHAKIDGNFEDIDDSVYYYDEIAIAKKLGITQGTGGNRFNPDGSITRQDMMVLTERTLKILNKLKSQGLVSNLEIFLDKSLIAPYAVQGIATLVNEGLIIGSDDKINPLGKTTRAEAAVFLYRIYDK